MKKFTKILALTLVLIMSVAMFASCAAPNKDPKAAAEALEDNGYKVVLFEGEDETYLVELTFDIEKVTAAISASKGDDVVEIFYFEDADAADAAFENVEKKAQDAGTTAKVHKSGSMIYYGTAAALKAAK